MSETYEKFTNGAKNLVFLGEAGSGKTETSINLARKLACESSRRVHFFDMDQTKPLFRARDCETELENEGIIFHFQRHRWTIACGWMRTTLSAAKTGKVFWN